MDDDREETDADPQAAGPDDGSAGAPGLPDDPAEVVGLFERLLEAQGRLGEGVLVYDLAEDEIVFATEAFYEVLDVTPDEIASLPDITHLVVDEHRPDLLEKMQGFLEGETVQDHEFAITDREGRWRWLRVSGSLLGPDDTRIVVTAREVSEEVRAEQERELLLELTRATVVADDLDDALSAVLAVVGRSTGWALGEAWIGDGAGSGLDLLETWSHESTTDAWDRATEDLDPDPDRGLPGSALRETHPVWIEEIASGDRFVRAGEAAGMGLDAAVGIPIVDGDEVLAVLLFLTDEADDRDRHRAVIVRDATAQLGSLVRRKQAEAGLRRRQRLLEATERTARIGHWSWDLETDQVVVSEEARRLLGLGALGQDEVTRGDLLDHVHPDDVDRVGAVVERLVEDPASAPVDDDYRVVAPDGTVRWLEGRTDIEVEDGRPIRIFGQVLDVTDRKEAERRLVEERDRLERAQQVARVGDWFWDVRTDEQRWSAELARIFGREPGFAPDSVEGFLELIHPDDRDRVRESMMESVARGESGDLEYRIVRPDGEVRWIVARAEAIVEDGETVAATGTLHDITERKQAEQDLADERDRLERAQALARVGDWTWDLRTDEITWSGELSRIHGRPPQWAPEDGQESIEVVHPDDRDRVMDAVAEALRTGEVVEPVYRIVRPDDEVRWLRGRIEAGTDETGEVVELHGTSHDVTESKETEQQLEAAHDRLERLLSQAPVILFALDADGVYQMSRGSGLEDLGLAPDEHAGESIFEVYADHPRIPDDARRALEGESFTSVVEIAGSWLQISYSPRLDAAGDVVGTVGVAVDVTEQQRTERQVEAMRDRLEFVVSESPAITYTAEVHPDADELLGDITFVSDNVETVTGHPPEMFLGTTETWIERVHPEDRDRLVERARELVASGQAETQYRVRFADGSYGWIRDEARIVTGADGTPRELVGSLLDVTDRVRAEQRVEALGERLRDILAGSPAITYTAAVHPGADEMLGDLTFVSDNVEELSGEPPETFIGGVETWLERIHDEDQGRLRERVRRLVDEGEVVVEYRFRTADGEWIWARDEARIVTDGDGEPRELVGSILDVTEQRKLEAEDRRKARMLDEVSDAVVVTDPEGKITYWNRAAEQLYGWTAEEVEGRDIMDVTVPEGVAEEGEEIMETVSEGGTWTGEFEVRRKDGSVFPARVSNTPILGEDGDVEAVIGISHDVSEDRARERELLQTANALEARNRQLRNLGVAAAHHLQEPIRDVVRFAELVEDRAGDRLTADDLDDLEVIRAGGERLQELVEAFQDYVEQATGDPPGDGPADAGEVLQKVLEGLDVKIDDVASITWDEAPRLGIAPGELETLLGHLIGNAIRFRDGDHVDVHVGFERIDEMWIVSVADDGIGIPSEHHERVFRPLETLHHRTDYPGVGIGLAICRGIVERRGGGIWVKSTPGEGATFYATVPAAGTGPHPTDDEVL